MSEKPTEPTLAEAIEEIKNWLNQPVLVYDQRLTKYVRRLVEAGEFEQRNASKAFDCYNTRSKAEDWRCPIRDKFDQQIQALRCQLDTLKKDKEAETEELVDELSKLRNQLVEKKQQVENIIVNVRDSKGKLWQRIRSQERELDNKDRRYEKMDEGYSHQIASLSMEIDRLEDEVDDLRLSTTPEFIEGMTKLDKALRECKIDWSKVKKRTVLVEDPEPTDMNWIIEKLKTSSNFPGRLGIVEKKLQILADKNPGCFDDSTLLETQ